MGKITFPTCLIKALIVMMTLGLIGCTNTGLILVVEGPTKVFKDYPASGLPNDNSVISTLDKGETCEIIQTRYSKDFMFYKIRMKDGREGYVQSGDKFRIEKRRKGDRKP